MFNLMSLISTNPFRMSSIKSTTMPFQSNYLYYPIPIEHLTSLNSSHLFFNLSI